MQFNHFERNICSEYENITQEICKSISDFVDAMTLAGADPGFPVGGANPR